MAALPNSRQAAAAGALAASQLGSVPHRLLGPAPPPTRRLAPSGRTAQAHYVGLINTKTSPSEIAAQAIEDARYMCVRQYGDAPEVEIKGRLDLVFSYIPSHLYYMLFEVRPPARGRAWDCLHSQQRACPPPGIRHRQGLEDTRHQASISTAACRHQR